MDDRSIVFARMKAARNVKSPAPTKLVTLAGVYTGDDLLKGFAADSEILAKAKGESPEFDNNFYKMCILDNRYLFDFTGEDQIDIL